jgi:hypothetical protein
VQSVPPLRSRQGRPAPRLHEGIPQHLREPLTRWAKQQLTTGQGDTRMDRMALALEIPHKREALVSTRFDILLQLCEQDDDFFLDMLHAALQVTATSPLQPRPPRPPHESLEQILAPAIRFGGQLGTVSNAGWSPPPKTLSIEVAIEESASDELNEAAANAYGREPNASDAWDHSIKAVEAVLRPSSVQTTPTRRWAGSSANSAASASSGGFAPRPQS